MAKKLIIHLTMNFRCDWGHKFLDNVDGKRFALSGAGPKGTDETFIFESESEQETQLWVTDICNVITSKRNMPKSLSSPVLRLEPATLSDISGTNSKTSQSSDTTLNSRLPTQNEYRNNMDQLFETFVKRGRNPENEFQLMKKLGEGGFGCVHLARRLHDQQLVALKVMKRTTNTDYQLIMEEVTALGLSSAHENIVNCLDCFITDTEVWLVMEYMYGGSLHSLLRTHGPLTEEHIAYVSKCLLSAIAFLHKSHRLHRDLKSDNIILGMDGEVKLTDFGFSAQLTQERQHRQSKCGTTAWMAPEVLLSQEYSFKADIWSFGILVLEMAEGTAPGLEMSETRLEVRIITKQPPTLRDSSKWSQDFQSFVSKILVKEPTDRWHAEELLEHPFIERASTKPSFAKVITYARMSRTTTTAPMDEDDWEFFTGHGLVVVDYDPEQTEPDHLVLRVGDKVIISSKKGKYFKGIRNGKETGTAKGIIPAKCVALHNRARNATPQPSIPEEADERPNMLKKAASAKLIVMEEDPANSPTPHFGKTKSLAGFAAASKPAPIQPNIAVWEKIGAVGNSRASHSPTPPPEDRKRRSISTPPPPEDSSRDSPESPRGRGRRKSSANSAMAFFVGESIPERDGEEDSESAANVTMEIHTPQQEVQLPVLVEKSPIKTPTFITSPKDLVTPSTATPKAFMFDHESDGEDTEAQPNFYSTRNLRRISDTSGVSNVTEEPGASALDRIVSKLAKARGGSMAQKRGSTHLSDSDEESPAFGSAATLTSVVIPNDDEVVSSALEQSPRVTQGTRVTTQRPRTGLTTRELLRRTTPAPITTNAASIPSRKSTSAIPNTSVPSLLRQGSDLAAKARVPILAHRTRSVAPPCPAPIATTERRRSSSRNQPDEPDGRAEISTARGRQATNQSVGLVRARSGSQGKSKDPIPVARLNKHTTIISPSSSGSQTARSPRTPAPRVEPLKLQLANPRGEPLKRAGSGTASPKARRSTGNTPPSPRQMSRLRSLNSMTNLKLSSSSEAEDRPEIQTDRPRPVRAAPLRASTASPRRVPTKSPTPAPVHQQQQQPKVFARTMTPRSSSRGRTQIATRTATPPRMPKTATINQNPIRLLTNSEPAPPS
eukprot:c14386_g1_i1.p1 GENE.c14386_g1_i1~~c14386_g1_i1.p1  ORF type:complete len:1185 (+),score=165.16 c14386_g1_i1:201-3557(+)